MKNWWERKKSKTRKHRKGEVERHTLADFLVDVLFWLPELIILPIRILGWAIRGFVRWFDFS